MKHAQLLVVAVASSILTVGAVSAPAQASRAAVRFASPERQLSFPLVPSESISVSGHPVSRVSVDGRIVTLADFYRMDAVATLAGHGYSLVMDGTAIKSGHFSAFSNALDASRYEATVAFTRRDALPNSHQARLGCVVGGGSYVKMYENASCGGQVLAMVANDYIDNMGTYGFHDKMSSAEVGVCVAWLKIWKDNFRGGSSHSFGSSQSYSGMPLGWNDVADSAQTSVKTAAC